MPAKLRRPKKKARTQLARRSGPLAQLAGLSEQEKRKKLLELLRADVENASDDADGEDEDTDWSMPSLDASGRTAETGPGLDFSFRSCELRFGNVTQAAELVRTCKLVHAFDGSSWLPCTARPRCLAERIASAVFRHHTRTAVFDESRSGAEWWAQVRQGGHREEAIQFHWDTDESAVEHHGVNIHPHLSTVTYLTDCGAPTLVLECRNSRRANALEEVYGPIRSGMLSRPRVGKHIVFDGQFLHGTVPQAGELGERVTFLVNIWLNHRPSRCPPLPEDLAKHLGDQGDEVELTAPSQPPYLEGSAETTLKTSFARGTSRSSVLTAQLPQVPDTATLRWAEGAAGLHATKLDEPGE